MALNYRIVNYKPTVVINGVQHLDLLAQTFDKTVLPEGQMIIVNKHYVARPDLISLALYQTDEYADVICKINGISNPFELNEDDVIFCPDIEYVVDCMAKNIKESDYIEDDDEDSPIILPTNDDNDMRVDADSVHMSNELVKGETNYVIDKSIGMVFY